MIKINTDLQPSDLTNKLKRFWELSGEKIRLIENNYDVSKGSPVFTINGQYTTRGWTEWTQGFQYGSGILQYDITGDQSLLDSTRQKVVEVMAPHISHIGVHDHGFNNVSTYGNLLRLMKEGKTSFNEWEKNFYELALKISGAVQTSRWTTIKDSGFIHSFNGPHSLFVDTIRSCRALMVSHQLGHVFQAEGDQRISLLERAVQHMQSTAKYSVFYGEGRDVYDLWGRTAHECIFNVKDGNYRSPNSQQGYTGFSTWTRGLAWAMCGFAEELEWFDAKGNDYPGKETLLPVMIKAARATCDFYINHTPIDGIPYWDTGAPNLYKIGDYLNQTANPYNDFEPVDSSAAAIAAQGLLRLGNYLQKHNEAEDGKRYWQAGLTVLNTIFDEPYLSTDPNHQGLLLHSVYHHPNGWDHIPEGSKVPNGESSMWGDYHAREVALYIQRIINNDTYYTFFNI
ncbi:glycoside hydrolase family 88 protein [Segetibacter aerophilus]|uniref:Glucuronyl hydrolase n=1 Tax=Segetibacter aerophilus TaxID=670293 RepID=A0A512BAU0_9BACT|nr:glycoside hydrolase family 88 protein [Segetibacter aerophilus]GEO09071.1 glucuronyl hydrolase [Segetibacter aerophilus]